MRTIKYTNRFKRDFKREKSGRHSKTVVAALAEIATLPAQDKPLERRHFDHALAGEWADHRDCHVKPDLVLIYRKPDADTLELVRIGSHNEIGF